MAVAVCLVFLPNAFLLFICSVQILHHNVPSSPSDRRWYRQIVRANLLLFSSGFSGCISRSFPSYSLVSHLFTHSNEQFPNECLLRWKKVVPVSRRPFPYRWYLRFVVVWRNLPGATTTGTTVEGSILHCRTNCMVTGSRDACARAHCGELFAEFYYLPLCGDACLSRKQAMVLR